MTNLALIPTSPARPNTPVTGNLKNSPRYKALLRQWAQVGKEPTPAAISEFEALGLAEVQLPPIPVGTPKGKWAYSADVTNRVLWREFGGRQFAWKAWDSGKWNAKATKALKDVTKDALWVKKQLDDLRGANPESSTFMDECVEFLVENIDAVNDLVKGFILSMGFNIPFLRQLKIAYSAGMAVYSGVGAITNARNRDKAVENKIKWKRTKTFVFDLAQMCLADCFQAKVGLKLVDAGAYTFDVVTAWADPGVLGAATDVARLMWNIKCLYDTWNTIRTVNNFLKQPFNTAPTPDMVKHMKENPLLGCFIFTMDNPLLTGHFSNLDDADIQDAEQQQILRLLGVDAQVRKQNAQKLDRIKALALGWVADAPYKLSPKTQQNQRPSWDDALARNSQ